MNDMQVSSYADAPPKFIAGAPGVDFLNTVTWRGDPSRIGERLTSYGELVIWCVKADLVSAAEARKLTAEAAHHSQTATRVLRSAIDLRDATVALVQSGLSNNTALTELNRCLSGAPFEYRIERDDCGHLRNVPAPTGHLLNLPLDRIAREIVTELTSGPPERIRSCSNSSCGWFFIDTSRNHARRWCQMATCGNQAKARAHYARRRRT